jgi:hypothetical protein
MTITFNGQTLTNASTYEDDAGVKIKETTLMSGETHVSASSKTSFKPSFTCYPDTASEITTLRGLIGSPCTLIIDSTSYTNCYISSFKSKQFAPGKYQYTISFVQHTA